MDSEKVRSKVTSVCKRSPAMALPLSAMTKRLVRQFSRAAFPLLVKLK
jgi:hypothetical protein